MWRSVGLFKRGRRAATGEVFPYSIATAANFVLTTAQAYGRLVSGSQRTCRQLASLAIFLILVLSSINTLALEPTTPVCNWQTLNAQISITIWRHFIYNVIVVPCNHAEKNSFRETCTLSVRLSTGWLIFTSSPVWMVKYPLRRWAPSLIVWTQPK